MHTTEDEKVVAIIQSSYVPWKGYFDIINQSDSFILLDDVQYTKRDWRSRNKIPTPQGERWLTVPVKVKGMYHQKICEAQISEANWYKSHWGVIENAYRKAPYFKEYKPVLQDLYFTATQQTLSEVNYHFLSHFCEIFDITTPLTWSMGYDIEEIDPTDRLVELCRAERATTYISGPAARSYLNTEKFAQHGIDVVFFDYSGYAEYPQLQDNFNHHVSIIDMIFMCGPRASNLIRRV